MKKLKKIVPIVLLTALFFSLTVDPVFAASKWLDLGGGYSGRIDSPDDPKSGKWHGHIYEGKLGKKGKQLGAENVDGTKHDGKTFKAVPNKAVKKLKDSKEWKKAKAENDKLMKEKTKLSWSNFLKWFARHAILL